MLNWLWRLMRPTPVENYRLIGIEERRQEEEIKTQILRKLRRRLKNEHGRKN